MNQPSRNILLRLWAITLLFVSSEHLMAQDSISVISGAVLEDLIENNDEQVYDFFSLYEDLQTYINNPLNINNADADDLRGIGLLTDIQIEDILLHRESYGNFLSEYELQSIPSLDYGTLSAVMPFISVGSEVVSQNIFDLFAEANHYTVLKYKRVLEEKKGYTERATSPYLGDQNQYYVRHNMSSGRNLRLGLTMEKDPGEEFFAGSNKKGFDYYSGFLHLRDIHPTIRTLNIGDFSMSMGQGLIAHNSFGGNKTAYVMDVKKGGRVIRPYSSVNEINYFRGLATTLQLGEKLELSLLASRKKIDGNSILDTFEVDGFNPFSSFVVNGLHRTQSEIAKRGTVTQTTLGGVLKYRFDNGLRLGLNVLNNRFDNPLQPDETPYRKFQFKGDKLTNVSVDYSYRYENFNFFGEVARSDNNAFANIHGVLMSLGRNVDAGLVYRNYEKDYQVLDGNAFAEGSNPINEQGLYLSLQYRPYRNLKISTYVDVWKNPWLRFNVNAPSGGREFLTRIEYNKKRKYNIYLQYRYEEKGENSSIFFNGIRPVVNKFQHRARLNFTNKYSKELTFVSRAEYNFFNKDSEDSQGYLVFQDVRYKPIGKAYSFAARYSLFDTDDNNSRIYAYENDVLYEFSVPFYSGSGSRFYIKGQYRLNRNMYIQIRYARTHLNNVSDILNPDGSYVPLTIGSGNEETIGNSRNDIKVVLKYNFK